MWSMWLLGVSHTLAQTPAIVITDLHDPGRVKEQIQALARHGFQTQVVVAPGCYTGLAMAASPASLRSVPGVGRVIDSSLDASGILELPKEYQVAGRWMNALLSGSLDADPEDPIMDWSPHGEHALERTKEYAQGGAPQLKSGPGSQPLDWTCTSSNNSEYLVGTVVASTFFLESNGAIDPNTYTWTQADIDDVKLQIIDAWSIWSYTASLHGQVVTAIMNWYEPSGGMSVQPYEPILRPSSNDGLWIDACMTNLGVTGGGVFGKLDAFNQGQRTAFAAQHAICAFIAYNPPSQGAPTAMTDGKIGYAYLGGPYTQLLFKANGWGTNQVNRVYAHETGHLFHAFDEYSSSPSGNCTRSFNGRVNSNYQGSPCNGPASCMMINNSFSGSGATRQWNLCTHTPFHLGWAGLVPVPVAIAPVNDAVVTSMPVILRWDRVVPPTGVYSYVKIIDRNTDEVVYCGYQGELDTLAVDLINGQYKWIVSQGQANDYAGYAGRMNAPAEFTVNAPLNAAFSVGDGTICAGASVTFIDHSTGAPTSWTWSFPGGTPSNWTGAIPPAIFYSLPGNYNVTLTVGDGLTTDPHSIVNAVVVEGGMAVPFSENFDGGVFPPASWISQGGGTVGGGQGGLSWTADATGSCSQGTSAYVAAYNFTGSFASPALTTPKISLVQVSDPYVSFRWSYAPESPTTTEMFRLIGRDCDYGTYAQLLTLQGSTAYTNGGGYVTATGWVPATCEHWRTKRVSATPLQGKTALFDFRLDTYGGQNFFLDDVAVFSGCRLDLRVLLEGPFVIGNGLMIDSLRVQGLIPLVEPFSANGHVFQGEGGGEFVQSGVLATTGPNAIVDWVMVEVRDALVPALVITSRAALLQRDGNITDLDGASKVRVGVPAGNYHVAVRHRNHLGVMTALPVALSQTTPVIDLGVSSTATWGIDARKIAGGHALMWAGDVSANGSLLYTGLGNDRDPILSAIGGVVPTNTATGYRKEDVTLDGIIKYTGPANDRDPILFNIGGMVPTNSRSQQLP